MINNLEEKKTKDLNQLDIIIPAYNEGENISNLYLHLEQTLKDKVSWRAFVVYDTEEDTTAPFVKAIFERDKRFIPIRQTYGKGALNALKFGFSLIHDGPTVVIMGDCSDDLNALPEMTTLVYQGATIVSPSRFANSGKYIGGSLFKRILSQTAGITLYIFGIGTTDPTNNFKMYSGKWIKSQKIESNGGFEIALELLVKAALRREKIIQIPTIWKDRTYGESNFNTYGLLPHYMKWFVCFIKNRIKQIVS